MQIQPAKLQEMKTIADDVDARPGDSEAHSGYLCLACSLG
jgi:hypothetical protein